MLKEKSVIELTDVHTGKKEHYEDTNLVTEATMDVLNCNIKGMLYNNTTFNGSNGDDWMLPLKKNIMGGILLYQNALEERADNIYAPLNNPLIGYASDDANNTEDIRRGSRNLTESKEVDGGYRFVWDFATSQANGTISAICLSNTLAGKGTQYAGNYMVRIGTWSANVQDKYKPYCMRGNKRVYIGEGYASYASWGRNQMARYKTYALREWIFQSNVYNLYRELFLFTPYLATINNLGTPVIKTADKTMKITYTITEE